MSDFPHLPLKDSFKGSFKFKQTPRQPNPKTLKNKNNRAQHGNFLFSCVRDIKDLFQADWENRSQLGLPLLNDQIIPIFLQVDPDGFDIESLKGFGIEIIAEEENGFIIGASIDGFRTLENKIESFVNNDKAKSTAMLWDIVKGQGWRIEHILSDELQQKWNIITDEEIVVVDISIACYLKCSDYPTKKSTETAKKFLQRIERWQSRNILYLQERDELEFDRQDEIEKFLELYDAEIISEFISDVDSFGFRVVLPGKALKDIVLNYPYVFEIVEHIENEISIVLEDSYEEWDVEILTPNHDAPKVCVVDSGIVEGHRLLSPSILSTKSINYVPSPDDTVSDQVARGGHGTRVAGAVLFGNTIPKGGSYEAPCFLYNARVLNKDNQMSSHLFPPELMNDVSADFNDAHIFNISINNKVACRITHMSQWAASLDKLANEESHLFVVSAGNLTSESNLITNPGIKNHRIAGREYPTYLLEKASRIADPAQSLFSITVGSVCLDIYEDDDLKSFGEKDHISSFSRGGLGLWNSIKPELVEYGGDWVAEKRGSNLVFKDKTCPETVVSKGAGIARDSIGTSYAAPKVTHILARLIAMFPDQSSLFHKALLLQSARLPEHVIHNPSLDIIRNYGYGIPNLERAVENSAKRITFTTFGKVAPGQSNLYAVHIPAEMRRQGENFDILIETSLCYTAKNRRTRRNINSYLSSWLTWKSAPMGQSLNDFKLEILKNIEVVDELGHSDPFDQPTRISWTIDEHPNWGAVKGIKRQSNANQKDWATVKSYELPSELSFAIVGHKGWEKNLEERISYAFVVSFEVLNGEIPLYELMSKINIEVEQEAQIELF
jgi:hypothetical protein